MAALSSLFIPRRLGQFQEGSAHDKSVDFFLAQPGAYIVWFSGAGGGGGIASGIWIGTAGWPGSVKEARLCGPGFRVSRPNGGSPDVSGGDSVIQVSPSGAIVIATAEGGYAGTNNFDNSEYHYPARLNGYKITNKTSEVQMTVEAGEALPNYTTVEVGYGGASGASGGAGGILHPTLVIRIG